MKRTRSIKLILMGSAALSLTACEDEVPVGAYESQDQCVVEGRYSADQCREAFATARKEHLYEAPRYTSRQDCEAEFGTGKCQSLSDAAKESTNPDLAQQPATQAGGSNLFLPLMAGYMVGRMTSGPATLVGQPLYRPVCSVNVATPGCPQPAGPATAGSSSSSSRTSSFGGYYTGSGRYVADRPGTATVAAATLTSTKSATSPSAPIQRGGFGATARSYSSSAAT